MPILLPLYLAFTLLLGVASVSKIRSPEQAVSAVRASGLPASRLAVRAFGGYEAALAVAAVVVSPGNLSVAAIALSGTYLSFALLTLRLVRLEAPVSCGCFGSADTRASWVHVFVTGLAALVGGAVAAVGPRSSLLHVVSHLPVGGVAIIASAVGVGVVLPAILAAAPTIIEEISSDPLRGSL
jgi:hypothetical protein